MSRPLTVMGAAEVAVELGVPNNTVAAWVRRGHLPPPDARLACGPIWRTSTIAGWITGDGRRRIARITEGRV